MIQYLLRKGKKGWTQNLTAGQEVIRQEAIRLGITDGKNPFREVNQSYVWACVLPIAKRVEELEKNKWVKKYYLKF